MSIQHVCAHGKRARMFSCLLAAASIVTHVSSAHASQLQVPTDVPQKPAPGPILPPPPSPSPPASRPITLIWVPPTENTNGSALTDLRAYRIYGGSTRSDLKARVTVRNPGLTSYVLEPASTAERYYAITAINSKGMESEFSNVVAR